MMFFGMFEVLFLVTFLLVIGIFAATFIQGIRRWNKDNHAPRLTVPASVVSKRTQVSRHRDSERDFHHTFTSCYVTFQFDSGDRMELEIADGEYGLLVEGDRGMLSFQGQRYLGFVRT